MQSDFTIAKFGNMVAVTPISADANKAIDAGLITYEDWQVMGGSIMVDHRCSIDLIENLRNDGFSVTEA